MRRKPGDMLEIQDTATLWHGPNPNPSTMNGPAWSFARGNKLVLVFACVKSQSPDDFWNNNDMYGIIVDDQIRWITDHSVLRSHASG